MQKLYFPISLILLNLWMGIIPAQAELIASGAENLNPELEIKPPRPIIKPSPILETPKTQTLSPLESIQTDFNNDQDNYGLRNQFIQSTAKFRLPNDQKFLLKTGANSFVQPDVEKVTNVPLQIGWEGKIRSVKLQSAIGVDLFNRLPGAVNLSNCKALF
jgi:hypothetical protein